MVSSEGFLGAKNIFGLQHFGASVSTTIPEKPHVVSVIPITEVVMLEVAAITGMPAMRAPSETIHKAGLT